MSKIGVFLTALVLAAAGIPAQAADSAARAAATQAGKVTIERIVVDSPSLKGNLEGNRAERDVWVALPPGYHKNPKKRYPVVYALHGYTMTPEKWVVGDKLEQRIGAAFGAGAREFIVVFPNAHSLHDGSMYSSSVTIGDWEGFITRDLVAHIDGRYRTIADRRSRGLMGHSMGGYGTMRLGMKYPDVYSSLYAMSACCLAAREITPEQGKMVEAVRTREQALAGNFLIRTTLTVAAAWAPNPAKPPFYADLPTVNGVLQPQVIAQWAANAPLAMLPQYVHGLRRYNAIALDIGDRDGLIDENKTLHELLERYSVAHSYEVYSGDHGSEIATRFETKVMPHFSRTLRF